MMNELHSCYNCLWECFDGCCLRRDENGNREPIYDEPTDCKDFKLKRKRTKEN